MPHLYLNPFLPPIAKLSWTQSIISATINAKAFHPTLLQLTPKGMCLLKRGTLPWLEREALETYGDAGYLGVIGDMVDEMDIPSSGDPGWQILRPERVVLISNLVSNETARAMYVRMFFGTFGRLPSRTQGKKPADIFETYLTALWRGSSWEVARAWVWHNFRPLAEALLRGMRLRSGKSRSLYLQGLEKRQCPEARSWNTALEDPDLPPFTRPFKPIDTNVRQRLPSVDFSFTPTNPLYGALIDDSNVVVPDFATRSAPEPCVDSSGSSASNQTRLTSPDTLDSYTQNVLVSSPTWVGCIPVEGPMVSAGLPSPSLTSTSSSLRTPPTLVPSTSTISPAVTGGIRALPPPSTQALASLDKIPIYKPQVSESDAVLEDTARESRETESPSPATVIDLVHVPLGSVSEAEPDISGNPPPISTVGTEETSRSEDEGVEESDFFRMIRVRAAFGGKPVLRSNPLHTMWSSRLCSFVFPGEDEYERLRGPL